MNRQVLVMAAAIATVLACATMATTRVVGVLGASSAPSTLQLVTKGSESITVRVDDKTAYMKWVTHKPWGSERLEANSLVQGNCVEVQMADSNVAKVVYVSNEPAGSIFDPCKGRR